MAETTGIEWCDATANLWWGCQHVHPGCDHCYAEAFAKGKGKQWDRRYEVPGVWAMLGTLQRKAAREGHRRTVFVGSMMDIFEKPQTLSTWSGGLTPISTGELRQRFFRETVPACPDLVFLLLTKRPGNIIDYAPYEWIEESWPENVWTGTSISDQATADILLGKLLRAPGRHFVSYEPALGPVNLNRKVCVDRRTAVAFVNPLTGAYTYNGRDQQGGPRLDWVIAGGESGHHARPPHSQWFRDVRDQCQVAGVPFLFKQWGEFRECTAGEWHGLGPTGTPAQLCVSPGGDTCGGFMGDLASEMHGGGWRPMTRVGKKNAGRLLDGREHLEFPEFQPCTEAC